MSDNPSPPKLPHFLVIVAEGEPAALSQYDSKDALVTFLRDHFHPEANARVQVFIFQGVRLQVTRGGSKYLLQEGEPPTPLFRPPSPSQPVSESGDWFDVEGGPPPHGYTTFSGSSPDGDLGDDPDA